MLKKHWKKLIIVVALVIWALAVNIESDKSQKYYQEIEHNDISEKSY